MPTGIAASDRKLLIICGIVLLVLLVGISILTPPSDTYSSPVPSTYSSQSGGAKAAYRLLTNLKYPVRRWESPPTELDIPAPNILLVLADPIQPPSKGERKALAEFVEDGGHVLFTGANIKDYFADAELPKERSVVRGNLKDAPFAARAKAYREPCRDQTDHRCQGQGR